MGPSPRTGRGSHGSWLLAGVPALVLAGCVHDFAAPAGSTFVVVRHGEKGHDDPRDPSLDGAGHARARKLAAHLSHARLAAAYATRFRRTRQTAQPAAEAHGLAVSIYDAALPAIEFAARLKREHPGDTVLVVGHSNTVPDIVSALCDCAVAPLGEHDYDRLYEVSIAADGRGVLAQRRY